MRTHALPIFRDHDVFAHPFRTTGMVGTQVRRPTQSERAPTFDMLNWGDVENLSEGRVRIEAHTDNHPDMRKLDDQGIAGECSEADRIIEERLGRCPQYFANPYSYRNTRALDYARSHCRATVTTQLRELKGNEDQAAVPRFDRYYL